MRLPSLYLQNVTKLSPTIKYFTIAVFLLFSVFIYRGCSTSSAPRYKTSQITQGELVSTITATGIVQPEESIDVGAQVAGKIIEFGVGKDGKPIDYGSMVEEGSLLAKIDESLYQSDAAQAEAQVGRAKADLSQSNAKLVQARNDWMRAQRLGPSDALSKSSYDQYQANFEVAKAAVAVSEAAVAQANAALGRTKQNLSYCVINSPVSGVIIDKRVSIGQTVVSSLNAPSFFLIAKDLKRMDVWLSVSEADIGNVKEGQRVRFSVDAFPIDTFEGTVRKVRLNAAMTQNVVTYTVEVSTDNSSGKLLPYLTANAQIEIDKRSNVFKVPTVALRWSPRDAAVGDNAGKSSALGRLDTIWIKEDSKPKAIPVKVGLSDGIQTEISGEGLAVGQEVIIGEEKADDSSRSKGASSPFAPQVVRGPRR